MIAVTDHYFASAPASPEQLRPLEATLAGRRVVVTVASGIFSPGGVDKGTRVLLDAVPPPPQTGTFLDLGCGWGPIALTLGLRAPHARVVAVDVNERSLDLTRRNAASLGCDGVQAFHPDEVPTDVSFDLLWSNPPIRVGKEVVHDLMRTWLPRLTVGGHAYLVVAKNLGGDSLHRWLGEDLGPAYAVTRHATSGGFRVLHVERRSA